MLFITGQHERRIMSEQVRFKDFGKKRTPVYFTVGDGAANHFDCFPALSLPALQEMALLSGGFSMENAAATLETFFKLVMTEEDTARFMHRVLEDKADPIELSQVADIMHWLVEVYGNRPTQPSSDSSSGQPNDGSGTTSVVGASELLG